MAEPVAMGGEQAAQTAREASPDVASHYAEIACDIAAALDGDSPLGPSSCCEPALTGSEAAALYSSQILAELPAGAQIASRGCGDPVACAAIEPGDTVCDLGFGGGLDALIASKLVGDAGRVIGVDMAPEMIELAQKNARDASCRNVEFRVGAIEELPLEDDSIDVIVSNCVVNLSRDKKRVFREALRTLVPGGRIVVSDIVMFTELPEDVVAPVCEITGCRNGMKTAAAYKAMLSEAGFAEVSVNPKTTYTLDVLEEKALRKGHGDAFALVRGRADVDGRCGSAIIRARKPLS